MKTLVILLGMISLFSENSYGFGSRRSSQPTPPNAPTGPALPAPPNSDVGTGGVKIVIASAKYFNTDYRKQYLEASRSVLEKVVNSEEFKQRVLNHTYNGVKTYVQNNGLTNQQIYNKIMSAAEEFPAQTVANNQVDLSLELYTSGWTGRNVVGYTNPGTSTIYMNTYFYDYATPSGTAGNMIHEWLHKLGFDHDYDSTARRPSSVPYAVGYIAEELAEKY